MAKKDRPHFVESLTREERVAHRVHIRHRLTPPIDVHNLASKYADFEAAEIPLPDVHALLVSQPYRTHPLIIVNKTEARIRQRFSIAHELGHLLIPWHACSISIDFAGDYLHSVREVEANRFAAELLIPAEWVCGIAQRSDSPDKMYAALKTADVSDEVIIIAWARQMPPGFVLALVKNSQILRCAQSPSTVIQPFESFGQIKQYDNLSVAHGPLNNGKIRWWQFGAKSLPHVSDKHSRDVLKRLFMELTLSSHEQRTFSLRLNGIIGATNNKRKSSNAEELHGAFLERFVKFDDELKPVVQHPRFKDFLALRAKEIAHSRSSP
jgi:hypothetical protein